MSTIVVLGDVNVDVISVIDGSINFASDTSSINRFAVGGSPCNMAAWAAKASGNVSLIADVGDDFLGGWVINHLSTCSIDTAYIQQVDGRTGTCVIIVDEQGQRTMFPDFGANLDVVLNDDRIRAITIASVLVMSAYTFMRPETQELARQTVEVAQASGTRIVIDAASSAPIASWGPSRVREFLSCADLVLANDDEISALTQDGHESWLHTLPNVVVKHGAGGASWWSNGELHTQLPAQDLTVIDTTGAGDALCGGLVARLVSHGDWDSLTDVDRLEALTFAIATASVCCTQIGAWPSGSAQ